MDCQLSEDLWQIIQKEFSGPGGHTFDLPICDFLFLQELPVVAKLFVPSVRCPICCHANDSDFVTANVVVIKGRLCPSRVGQVGVNVGLTQIDKRLQQLLNYDQTTSYSKQKDSLYKQLEAFL